MDNLVWIASKRPGTFWLLGNVRPIDAKAALLLPLLLGAAIGGGLVWIISRQRRAAAILDALAAGYSCYSLLLKDGAIYLDGVKGRYVSTDEHSSSLPAPAFDVPYTVKQARAALDRAGYECLD
ncbi:hypothetical protein LOB43_02770 [Lactobacillus delbrueckii subsp. lactis]|uniref:hypothetical protein n=1 Tax=Lactobacillus delbrueckii TaxID=1584 RepID=UPI0021820C88|nr:hypothetical protein [Lactobacillus delbrueckii]MCD5531060.1 hypothetical protein [Lactobacillus delbrueckii subsp. lactis]